MRKIPGFDLCCGWLPRLGFKGGRRAGGRHWFPEAAAARSAAAAAPAAAIARAVGGGGRLGICLLIGRRARGRAHLSIGERTHHDDGDHRGRDVHQARERAHAVGADELVDVEVDRVLTRATERSDAEQDRAQVVRDPPGGDARRRSPRRGRLPRRQVRIGCLRRLEQLELRQNEVAERDEPSSDRPARREAVVAAQRLRVLGEAELPDDPHDAGRDEQEPEQRDGPTHLARRRRRCPESSHRRTL